MTEIETLEMMLRQTCEVEKIVSSSSFGASEMPSLKYRIQLLKGEAWIEFSKRSVSSNPTPFRSCLLATHLTLSSVDPNDLPDGRRLSNLMSVIKEDIERTIKLLKK